MELKKWNTLFEKRKIQENYVPLSIWFGVESEYIDLLHYRIVENDTIIELHFDKKDTTLKNFIIINLDKNTEIDLKNDYINNLIYSNAELVSLYCDKLEWENHEKVCYSGFISDNAKIKIERYHDAFKLKFSYSPYDKIDNITYKLSENFLISLSPQGKIISVIILKFSNFQELY